MSNEDFSVHGDHVDYVVRDRGDTILVSLWPQKEPEVRVYDRAKGKYIRDPYFSKARCAYAVGQAWKALGGQDLPHPVRLELLRRILAEMCEAS